MHICECTVLWMNRKIPSTWPLHIILTLFHRLCTYIHAYIYLYIHISIHTNEINRHCCTAFLLLPVTTTTAAAAAVRSRTFSSNTSRSRIAYLAAAAAAAASTFSPYSSFFQEGGARGRRRLGFVACAQSPESSQEVYIKLYECTVFMCVYNYIKL